MVISTQLPMVVVASFQQLFTHDHHEYTVLFEGKTQASPWTVSRWELTIREHPQNGLVKYVLEKDFGKWASVLRVNGLGLSEESVFMEWARGVIG